MATNEDRVTWRDLQRTVNRIEDKIDTYALDIDRRVGALESFQSRLLGVVSVLSVFVSAAATFVWNKVTGE